MKKIIQLNICGNISYDNAYIALIDDMFLDKDEDVIGIILWVNSGGGSLCVAQDIVALFIRLNIPIVSVINEVCASAAYYTILPSQLILCRPASLIGGLCTNLDCFDYSHLHQKLGVKKIAHSHGQLKQMLSPHMICDLELEKVVIDNILTDLDQQFHEFIKKYRTNIDSTIIYKDGRLMTGVLAKKAGLVDDFGGIYTAFQILASTLNINTNELELIRPEPEELPVVNQQNEVESFVDLFQLR